MEYKKINENEYTLHLINTNRFKMINVVLFLTKKFNKKDIVNSTFLTQNLVYTSKKYNTKNKMAKIGEELYGSKVSASFNVNGICESLIFTLDFLNPKYTNKKYTNKSLDLLTEILFNPNIEDNKFNSYYFNIIKKNYISKIKSIKDNPSRYSNIQYNKYMYNNTPASYSNLPTLKEIEEIDEYKLYDYYLKLFNGEFKIDIAVLGEIDDNIEKLIKNKFKNIKGSNTKLDFNVNFDKNIKVNEVIESLDFNQSKLYMGYRLIDLSYHEINHVLKVYNTMLGTMNDSILFNVVREKKSLCYSIGSYISKYNPSLTIYAGINKENYDQTVRLIKECVNSMKDEKVVSSLIDYSKQTINTFLNNYYDDVTSQINKYYMSEFDYEEDIETLRDNINSVSVDEIIKLNNKIKLSTIYFLKGDN